MEPFISHRNVERDAVEDSALICVNDSAIEAPGRLGPTMESLRLSLKFHGPSLYCVVHAVAHRVQQSNLLRSKVKGLVGDGTQ